MYVMCVCVCLYVCMCCVLQLAAASCFLFDSFLYFGDIYRRRAHPEVYTHLHTFIYRLGCVSDVYVCGDTMVGFDICMCVHVYTRVSCCVR